MEYRKLSTTDTDVSVICLGTMSWGKLHSQTDAFEQMDYALSRGVNFWDTAEMYPVPADPETVSNSERIIGHWFAKTKRRKDVVLATKAVGPNEGLSYMRDGETPRLDKKNLRIALENSLKRLQTDYIDLYQLHWPDRNAPRFATFEYTHQEDEQHTDIAETLEILNDFVQEGLVRHIGLSNETPWGTMRFLQLAKENSWARPVSIQNHYNVLDRSFEMTLAEVSHREDIGLLAYSPLAMGVLSGKYLNGTIPTGSRFDHYPNFNRFESGIAKDAIRAYQNVATDAGLELADLAQAFVNDRPFVTSNIIGASSIEQLKKNIDSIEIKLSADVLEAIEGVFKTYRNVTR